MKKISILVALLILPLNMLFAHPPTEMNCRLKIVGNDLNQDEIALFIVHNIATSEVKDGKVHFIKTITINVNGKLTDTFSYTIQRENLLKHNIRIRKVKPEDKIVITATCSLGGEMTQEIIVPKPGRRR